LMPLFARKWLGRLKKRPRWSVKRSARPDLIFDVGACCISRLHSPV
jgi:hypothetical protein